MSMKIAIFSNFFNNHLSDFCDELYLLTKHNFLFVSKTDLDDTRKRMGFNNLERNYIRKYDTIPEKELHSIINEYEVIITGANSDDIYRKRLKTKKLLFKMSERPFKGDIPIIQRLIKRIKWFFFYKNKPNAFLLALSSKCANDFSIFAFKNRVLTFGYFPSFFENNDTFNSKTNNSILWVGRMIWWKHPELFVETIKKINSEEINITATMIGSDYSFPKIKELIIRNKLESTIHLVGLQTQEKTIEIMKHNQFFIFTSDSNEGWGAVLNEAMNSKCICLASKYAGSSNILINESNGVITDNTVDDIVAKLKKLLSDHSHQLKNEISNNAYRYIRDEFNGKIAAKRIIEFSKEYLENNVQREYKTGLLSKQLRK